MFLRKRPCGFVLAAAATFFALPAARGQETVTAHVLVTAVTHSKAAQTSAPTLVPRQSVSVTENGKPQEVSSWVPLRGERAGLELVILLDDSSRSSVSLRLDDLRSFVRELPPSTAVAVGYMRNGSPNLARPFTTDHAAAAQEFRLPMAQPGINASPYFCLSELVKRWPGGERRAGRRLRREVIMVTDGVDPQWGRGYDPEDPYVLAAVHDAQKAGVIVYSIYYAGAGRGAGFEVNAGQNYLAQVSSSTGGEAYFQGFTDPVSLQPFLSDIRSKLENQYELGFVASPSPQLRRIAVKTTAPSVKLLAPKEILAAPGGVEAP